MKSIKIIGTSYSSLLTRLALCRFNVKSPIKVVETSKTSPSPRSIEIGLWSQGLSLIRDCHSGAYDDIVSKGVWCGGVEYRGGGGRGGNDRLIGGTLRGRNKDGLDAPSDTPGLLFVDQKHLLSVLRSAVMDVDDVEYGVDPGLIADSVTGGSRTIDCSGCRSSVRRLLFPSKFRSLRSLNFAVRRGGSSHSLKGASFQSLGPNNSRFAAVPSTDGGCTWFSTTELDFWSGKGECCDILRASSVVDDSGEKWTRSEGRLERSDGKSIIPPFYITNNLPLVASLLASPTLPTLFAICFTHRSPRGVCIEFQPVRWHPTIPDVPPLHRRR